MKRKNLFSLFIALFTFTLCGFSQPQVIKWHFSLQDKGNGEINIVAKANVSEGWHIYDTDIPKDGPFPTTLTIENIKGAQPVGKLKAEGRKPHVKFDDIFQMQIGTFDGTVSFVQRLRVTDKEKFAVSGDVRAQACDASTCTPPLPVDFSFDASQLPKTVTNARDDALSPSDKKHNRQQGEKQEPNSLNEKTEKATLDSLTPPTLSDTLLTTHESSSINKNVLWTPVISELQAYGMKGSVTGKSLWWIFISGFIGGLIALLTPCVWPMIPMTVSFFLKRNKTEKGKAISEAILYGIAIIIIYVGLGLIITGIFGASALNDLATSAIFNIIFFALLVVFAISFFGAFELVLPSSWTNKMDSKADATSGILSIFFMAFTLVLVSFSCTGPIIGTLLVEAATSNSILSPTIGMLGFALALAIPFALFAIFPSWLQNMPKSGGWLNSVKVVLGFLELALALKFLSVADLAYGWRILDREVFLVLWIVIFFLLGLYLLGKLKLPHDSDLPHVSVSRLFMAIISFAFALYMIPGLWGAPLKAISAFSPPMNTQDFNLYEGEVHAKSLDYETGMALAKQLNKPVMIDFSGYGCVNCRNMEASVWTDARVKNIIDNEYILITLMVDDKKRLAETIEVQENGKTTKLKTIGDKWSYLQRHKFGANAQPYYVLLNHQGKPIAPSYAFDLDVNKYIDFLQTGLKNFNEKQ